jgi:hypothetical protein
MATAAYPGSGTSVVTKANADSFIPALWSDEIIASYEKSLVMANLVRRINHKGKKGDSIIIPVPTRATATQKAAATAVSITADLETSITVNLDQHWQVSKFIEDIADVQALSSMRAFYTDDFGYSLANAVDSSILALGRQFNNGTTALTYTTAFIGGDGTTLYNSGTPNANNLTDAAIRRTIQRLDDSDTPMDRRYFVIAPSQRNVLMGLDRYTIFNSVGESGKGNTVRNGLIGDLYGVEVFVTSKAETATGAARANLMFHADSLVFAEQLGVRTQTQYKQEYLSDLMTADTLYGVQILRKGDIASVPSGGFALMTP